MTGNSRRARSLRRCWRRSDEALNLLFETVDAVAHAAAVDFELRLAGAAPADAAREPRERGVCPAMRRGSRYFSCASSTWSLPSRDCARWAKMSRMSCVRSITLRSVASESERTCAGDSSRSKTIRSAPSCSARTSSSSSLPRPSTVRGSIALRRWMTLVEHDDAGRGRQLLQLLPWTLRPRTLSRSSRRRGSCGRAPPRGASPAGCAPSLLRAS